ncbi:IS66 C-terminal element [Erythrobacter sanguineus]|uniref:IS66 C-terminal element n=1 Tax=Erythrobacter sanguineus TaxID=198312 RepID=A0A1M7T2A8_9SPHN|nr:IS66 C-terminal element [Erythrobacter sanguineus]
MIVYEHVTCEQNGRGLSAALPHGPGRRRLERENNGAQQIGEAISYALKRRDSLTRFLDDGRIDLDNNAVERAIRPLALNRKNALFAGSDEGGDNWAVIATLIENCKLNGINPHTWLTATLTSLANGHPASRVDELLPHAHVA